MKLRTIDLSLPFTDAEVMVIFTYHKGQEGKMYLRNGDPGYPSEPPSVEIHEVYFTGMCEGCGQQISHLDKNNFDIKEALSKEVMDRLEEKLLETNWDAEDRIE